MHWNKIQKKFINVYYFISLFSVISCTANEHPKIKTFDKQLNSFNKEVFKDGKIHYSKVVEYKETLFNLTEFTDTFQIGELKEHEKMSFYINAYNINVLGEVMNVYPNEINSSKFLDSIITISGISKTIGNWRKWICNETFKDKKLHFTLFLPGRTGIPYPEKAFEPNKVKEQVLSISNQLAHDEFVIRVRPESKYLVIPVYFNWFSYDFKSKEGIRNWLNAFRTDKKEIPVDYVIEFFPHTWKY